MSDAKNLTRRYRGFEIRQLINEDGFGIYYPNNDNPISKVNTGWGAIVWIDERLAP